MNSPTPEPSDVAAGSNPVPGSSKVSPSPTIPSPGATLAPRASVEATIVDTPGVPASLYEKYWVALGQVGQVGTTARMIMPSNEGVLGADSHRVASIAFDSNYEPVLGPNGVTIVIRDLMTGAIVRTFDTPILVEEGLITGSLLFWRGVTVPLNSDAPLDGGIWVVDLADPASLPRAIIAPADLTAKYGAHAARGLLQLTDGGRTLITLVQGETARATDIIDVSSGVVRQTLDGLFAVEVTGNLAITAPIQGDGDDPARPKRLRVIDMVTGQEIGEGVATDMVKSSVLGVGEVFVQFGRNGSDSIIAAIDLRTGQVRDIRTQIGGTETLDLSHALSEPDLLVLLPVADLPRDDRGRVLLPVSLLDPGTQILKPDAFTIGSP